ncbi:HNH endonuclease [Pseudanabaena sp. PCC 6802]|uniref:HNH endonuclease n=1 Tax=Pseudanabaena sp. PCC 6802 TaxID=118173 RepID=UPI00034866A0|nr:HNH endonuclease [Pseudanabaena sp. PCC 6802]
MAKGRRWSKNELIIAMNLYCKLPFGQLDHRTPIIIEIAKKLGRTPSSLAMKLSNFASLDPTLQERGIKGLQGASQADREIWQEFNENWEELGAESEKLFQALFEDTILGISFPTSSEHKTAKPQKVVGKQPTGSTETEATMKVRVGQDFFRQTVLANYNGRCCITGNPVPELLTASHILPWSKYPEHRLNPHNGLCLSKTQDAAFDRGLIAVDENYRLILSSYLQNFLPEPSLEQNFVAYCGQQLLLPEKFQPDLEFLKRHRDEIFLG